MNPGALVSIMYYRNYYVRVIYVHIINFLKKLCQFQEFSALTVKGLINIVF